jgi:hypothetical protein
MTNLYLDDQRDKNKLTNDCLSNCCEASTNYETKICSNCNEHCAVILQEPTAFHQWLLVTSEHNKENLIALLRSEIIDNNNLQVFELMDLVDTGEKQYNSETLKRVADILIDTKEHHTNNLN